MPPRSVEGEICVWTMNEVVWKRWLERNMALSSISGIRAIVRTKMKHLDQAYRSHWLLHDQDNLHRVPPGYSSRHCSCTPFLRASEVHRSEGFLRRWTPAHWDISSRVRKYHYTRINLYHQASDQWKHVVLRTFQMSTIYVLRKAEQRVQMNILREHIEFSQLNLYWHMVNVWMREFSLLKAQFNRDGLTKFLRIYPSMMCFQ